MSVGDFIQGANDEAELQGQWDHFLPALQPLRPPFFFVPGNHDIDTPPKRRVYTRRIGRSYYHFVYRDVLFLCLDSQDPSKVTYSSEQVEYARRALDANPAVRWTFVFTHKPAWWMRQELGVEPTGWDEIEAMLQGRPYTVFAGHVHRYLKEERFGREYYTLGTTGGASGQRGSEMGEFDHITWVAMGSEGPMITHLELGGILPTDLRTSATADIAERGKNLVPPRQVLRFSGTHLQEPVEGVLRVRHGARLPARLRVRFRPHRQVRIKPRVIDLGLAPGGGSGRDDVQPQAHDLPFRIIPLRPIAAEDLAPVLLSGTIEYQVEGRSPVSLPVEQTVLLERNWPLPAGVVDVDGRLGEWGQLPLGGAPREVGGQVDDWTGPQDATVSFDLRHDEHNVYIAVSVTDDHLVTDADGQTDRLDLWFDARPEGERLLGPKWQWAMYRLYVRLGLVPAADGSVRLADADKLPAGTRVAGRRTAAGWDAEVVIPLAYLQGLQGESWRSLRLNVSLQDADDPGTAPASINWMPDWRGNGDIPGSGTFLRSTSN